MVETIRSVPRRPGRSSSVDVIVASLAQLVALLPAGPVLHASNVESTVLGRTEFVAATIWADNVVLTR
jgi:hypothetical protein